MVSLEEILGQDILDFSQASSSFSSGSFEGHSAHQNSFPASYHDPGPSQQQQLAWSQPPSQQLEQSASYEAAPSHLSDPQRVTSSHAGAQSDHQTPTSFSLDALGPDNSPGTLSQEDLDFILGNLAHDDFQVSKRAYLFVLLHTIADSNIVAELPKTTKFQLAIRTLVPA